MKDNAEQAALWETELHSEEPKIAQCNPDWKPEKRPKSQADVEVQSIRRDDLAKGFRFSVIMFNPMKPQKPIKKNHIIWRDKWLEAHGYRLIPIERLAGTEEPIEDAFACLEEEYEPTTASQQRDETLGNFFGATP